MITLQEAALATGGQFLTNPLPLDTPLHGGAFDTRNPGQAQIFFALKGEKADGHDHLHQLAKLPHIRLAVVQQDMVLPGFDGAVLRVADTLAALGRMGHFALKKHRPQVVAITGSYGKTTAKELIAHVLAAERTVLKTPGSLNNEIGLPITLLELDGSQQVAVLEFAARHPGDIDLLGQIAPPDVAVLLNVGRAHIGVFGSQEAILHAKGEIFHHLRPGGLAVVCAEDPRLLPLAQGLRIQTFGLGVGDYRAEDVRHDEQGRQIFQGVHGDTRLALRSGLPGPHGLYPVLAAWAVAQELGVSTQAVTGRCHTHSGQTGRAVLLRTPGGAQVIDDTYNASPETVINLIRTLALMAPAEKVLVLGHLSEQDGQEAQALEAIARHLVPPLSRVVVHDPAAPHTAQTLKELSGGFAVSDCPTLPLLLDELKRLDRPGVVVGIKGSRSAHMERAVLALQGQEIHCEKVTCGFLKNCAACEFLRLQP